MNARAGWAVAALLCAGLVAGCGTGVGDTLGGLGLFPDASSLTQEVKVACDGVLTEQEMVTDLLAARIDRANGYTKSEELLNVSTNCALDAAFSGVSAGDCTACKTAILDQVYGR
ncbi:MAG: hypothetical protein H6816_14365 [Phycisphaerales bacterium]|nr:hypothetical protein [Phycisphaerales bacterium]